MRWSRGGSLSHDPLKAFKTFMFPDRRCWFPRQPVQKQRSIQQIAQRRGLLPLWLQEDPRSTGTPRSGAWHEGCLSRVTCPALCWSIVWMLLCGPIGGLYSCLQFWAHVSTTEAQWPSSGRQLTAGDPWDFSSTTGDVCCLLGRGDSARWLKTKPRRGAETDHIQ